VATNFKCMVIVGAMLCLIGRAIKNCSLSICLSPQNLQMQTRSQITVAFTQSFSKTSVTCLVILTILQPSDVKAMMSMCRICQML